MKEFSNILFIIFLMLGCYVFFLKSSHAAPVVVYQDYPILNDQTISVDTYYNDTAFDGYHTIIYSQRQPQNLFLHEVNWDAIHIVHTWAKAWIVQKINEMMIRQCQSYCDKNSKSELCSIAEDENEEEE